MTAPAGRRIATFYLPITVDTLVKAQRAFEDEFPRAVVCTDEGGDSAIMHIESEPTPRAGDAALNPRPVSPLPQAEK